MPGLLTGWVALTRSGSRFDDGRRYRLGLLTSRAVPVEEGNNHAHEKQPPQDEIRPVHAGYKGAGNLSTARSSDGIQARLEP